MEPSAFLLDDPSSAVAPPNSTSLALARSPSGPVIVVKVWPQRGPGAALEAVIGNRRGLGTPARLTGMGWPSVSMAWNAMLARQPGLRALREPVRASDQHEAGDRSLAGPAIVGAAAAERVMGAAPGPGAAAGQPARPQNTLTHAAHAARPPHSRCTATPPLQPWPSLWAARAHRRAVANVRPAQQAAQAVPVAAFAWSRQY